METNAIILVSETTPAISTFHAETMDDKKRFYNALNNPTGNIKDIIGQVVAITDFSMTYEQRETEDDEGETYQYDRIRTVVILSDGRSYETTYKSFAKSLVQLCSVFGSPDTWENHKLDVIIRTVSYQGGLHDGLTIDVA